MENSNPVVSRRGPKPSEEGYLLLAVMFLLAVLVLSLAAAAPNIARSIQRDRDVETMERGKQYERAVQLYYRRFHAYPPNVDALVKTNDIRFLRKRYADPITGKDDWKPILFGQNKPPVAMGFFGQPLAGGSTLAGTGPSGGSGVAGASPIGGGSSALSTGSSFSSSSSLSSGSSFSGGSSLSSGSSMFGSSPTNPATDSGLGTGSNPATGVTGGGTVSSGSSGFASGTTISSNQTFGGGGIIGFSPGSDKQSILVYKKKNHYNEWEFLYSPLSDQMMSGGNLGTVGQPAGSTTGTGMFGTSGTQGSGLGNSLGGSSPASPTAPATPATPTSPQQ